MKTSDFYFDLPEHLIAQFPPEIRGTCRLLTLDRETGVINHHTMRDFPEIVPEDALIIFNNTRVRKSRLYGFNAETGGKVEFFLLKPIDDCTWDCLTSKSKKQKPGKRYRFPGELEGEILEKRVENHSLVRFSRPLDEEYLNEHAHVPLPPYIKREDRSEDSLRYQTVFARETGSSAAPTASLHFTEDILKRLKERGVEYRFVTLHVGLGTFAPVREHTLEDHRMHEEEFQIDEETASSVEEAHRQGRPVIAVGTTSLRALESAWDNEILRRGRQKTSIFIFPGYRFKVVDKLFTNFHTPESTLLMLVSAFAGRDRILKAYNEAISREYRFFSYGDAMLIG